MNEEVTALRVGKWTVGFSNNANLTIMKFEFIDHPSVILAISHDQASALARGILEQNKPSEIHRIS